MLTQFFKFVIIKYFWNLSNYNIIFENFAIKIHYSFRPVGAEVFGIMLTWSVTRIVMCKKK